MNYLQKEITQLSSLDPTINQLIQKSGKNGYWIWDLEQTEYYWFSPSFWNHLGYEPDNYTQNPNFWTTVIDDADLNYCYFKLHSLLNAKSEELEQTIRFQNKNGSYQWFSCKGKIIYDDSNKPKRAVGIISEKKKLEDLEEYRTLLEQTNFAAQIGTWEVLLDTQEVYWSEVTKAIHEVEDTYICDFDTAVKFYHEDSIPLISEAFKSAITTGKKYDVELELLTAKGNRKWVRAIGIPIFKDGECKRVHGLFQDIDEKTRTVQKLAHQERLFRRTFEYASIGMALVGLDGRWLRVNQSLCEILGYTNEELLALSFQDITHPADLNIDLENVQNLIEGKNDSYQMEKRYFHKNGDIIWVLLAVSLVRDSENNPLHFVSQINDISKRKESQQQAEYLLNITADQNKRLLNFAHIVSHNLRSHSGNLTMLLDLMKVEHPTFAENEFFPLFEQAVQNLSETITHLNEVVLVQTKGKKDVQKLNLSEFINKTLQNLQASIIETKTTIINNVPNNININYIPAYLDSILLNLLTNAIKYRAEERLPVIEISLTEDDSFYTLFVKDNGLGIDLAQHKEKLFGMYKTFHNHKDARGIGLFLTKNQVESMEGSIDVASTINQGTTFKVLIKK